MAPCLAVVPAGRLPHSTGTAAHQQPSSRPRGQPLVVHRTAHQSCNLAEPSRVGAQARDARALVLMMNDDVDAARVRSLTHSLPHPTPPRTVPCRCSSAERRRTMDRWITRSRGRAARSMRCRARLPTASRGRIALAAPRWCMAALPTARRRTRHRWLHRSALPERTTASVTVLGTRVAVLRRPFALFGGGGGGGVNPNSARFFV
jgi:hypothetical protein